MDFALALHGLCKNITKDGRLTEPFCLYSMLSDLCSTTLPERKKVSLFYRIDSEIGLFCRAVMGERNFKKDYPRVENLINKESFNSLVTVVIDAIEQREKPLAAPSAAVAESSGTTGAKPAADNKTAKVKQASPIIGKSPAVVVKAATQRSLTTATPLSAPSVKSPPSRGGKIVTLSLIIAFIAFILFSAVFKIGWGVWQWVVGIVGGALLTAIVMLVLFILHDELIMDFYVLGSFVLGVFIILNFTLLLLLRSDYKVIYYSLSAYEILAGLFTAILSYDEFEKGWGTCQLIESLVAVILIIVGACTV